MLEPIGHIFASVNVNGILDLNFTMFFLFNRVGAGHMAAGRGRFVPPPALDTGEKVGTSKHI